MSSDVDIVIIGAGVVGLAVAAELAREKRAVFILEKNETFGRETSSRNSGTIHTGIMSPSGSLNSRLCLAGNRLIYEICDKCGVNYRKTGKLIVACNASEVAALEEFYQRRVEGTGALTASIKRARHLALLPFVPSHIRRTGGVGLKS